MSEYAIELEGVRKSYGTRVVLRHLDLRVPTGSLFAFLGNNGHGKSTTIRIMTGLARAQAGSIRVLGQDMALARKAILRQLGCLVEAPAAYANLHAREFLHIGCLLKNVPLAEADRVMETVGLQAGHRQCIGDFSLGMKQRLALANALIGQPRLLVLDEPTNGLDPEGIRDIRELLRRLPEQTGCTVFFSSHQLDEVEKTASHVAFLREGRTVFQGAMADLPGLGEEDLVIDVGDPSRAGQLIREAGFAAQPEGATNWVVRAATREDAARLNGLLVTEGVPVFGVTRRRSTLEAWFARQALVDRQREGQPA